MQPQPTGHRRSRGAVSRLWDTLKATTGMADTKDDYLVFLAKRLAVIAVGSDANKVVKTAERLNRDFAGHFLVWNLTDIASRRFDVDAFNKQVIDVADFPKYIPPLHYTYNQCNMLRYWLKEDPRNIAVIMYEVPPGDMRGVDPIEMSINIQSRVVPPGDMRGVDPIEMSINIQSRVIYLLAAFLSYLGEF
ncbi:hypothetical protein T484DRAFT_1892937, partial [Baffinella frigidus]